MNENSCTKFKILFLGLYYSQKIWVLDLTNLEAFVGDKTSSSMTTGEMKYMTLEK